MGEVAVGLDNVRGLGLAPNGNVFVCNAGTGGAGFGTALVEVEPTGALVTSFATGSPFDVLLNGSELLVADIDFDTIERFDSIGNALGTFSSSPNLDLPEQIQHTSTGCAVAGFGSNGIYLSDATGVETQYIATGSLGFGGVRSAYELQNGNFLFTNGAGIHVYDMAAGVVTTQLMGVAGRFLTEYSGGGSCVCGGNYCTPGAINSTGAPGHISVVGNASVAANDVTLLAIDQPPNQFGYFVNSMTQVFVPNPGGSRGTLCVVGAIGRYTATGQLFNSGATGTGSLVLSLRNTPTPVGPLAIAAGETWNFQRWYRDLNPGPNSNFTDALVVGFTN